MKTVAFIITALLFVGCADGSPKSKGDKIKVLVEEYLNAKSADDPDFTLDSVRIKRFRDLDTRRAYMYKLNALQQQYEYHESVLGPLSESYALYGYTDDYDTGDALQSSLSSDMQEQEHAMRNSLDQYEAIQKRMPSMDSTNSDYYLVFVDAYVKQKGVTRTVPLELIVTNPGLRVVEPLDLP